MSLRTTGTWSTTTLTTDRAEGAGGRACLGGLRGSLKQPPRGGHPPITLGAPVFPLAVLFGLNAVDELDRAAFAVLLPDIHDHFGLSDATALALVAATTIAILLVELPPLAAGGPKEPCLASPRWAPFVLFAVPTVLLVVGRAPPARAGPRSPRANGGRRRRGDATVRGVARGPMMTMRVLARVRMVRALAAAPEQPRSRDGGDGNDLEPEVAGIGVDGRGEEEHSRHVQPKKDENAPMAIEPHLLGQSAARPVATVLGDAAPGRPRPPEILSAPSRRWSLFPVWRTAQRACRWFPTSAILDNSDTNRQSRRGTAVRGMSGPP